MKTKLAILLLIILALSSCKTAKHYANYRFGGKSKQESKTFLKETNTEEVSVQIQEKNSDTLFCPIQKDSSTSEFAPLVDEKSIVLKTKKTTKAIENKNPDKKEKLLASEKSSKKTFPIASKRKNAPLPKSSLKGSGFDIDDLLYTLGVIAIIAGGAFSLYLLGVTLLEILTFVVGMILVVILLSLLGNAIMGIFPGMSKKNKKTFAIKNILGKIFPSRSMKYYGGMSVKSMFWIGTGLIAVGLLVASIYTAPFWVFDILFSLFSIWLVGCLIVGAFVAIFEGITR
jgi:hypothetical protein